MKSVKLSSSTLLVELYYDSYDSYDQTSRDYYFRGHYLYGSPHQKPLSSRHYVNN